jgi:hypothetical protein
MLISCLISCLYHTLLLLFREIIQRKLLTKPAVKLRSKSSTRIGGAGGGGQPKQNRDEVLRAELIHPDFLLHRFSVLQVCYYYYYYYYYLLLFM